MAPRLLIFLLAGIGALVMVGIGIYRITRSVKKAGGLQGVVNKIQAQVADSRPSMSYPIVMPTFKTSVYSAIAAIMLLAGLLLIAGGWFLQHSHIHEVRLLETEGVAVSVPVVDKRISRSDDSDDYYITFAYTAIAHDQRVNVERKVSVPRSYYDGVAVGREIEVIYARSDPEVVKIGALYTVGKVEYWRLILLGGAGGLCVFGALMLFREQRRARRLDIEGVTTTSALLDCYESSDSESTTYYIAYDLPGVGPVRQFLEEPVYQRLKPGDKIQIVYLPDMPKLFRLLLD